jgi:hypothetical protein
MAFKASGLIPWSSSARTPGQALQIGAAIVRSGVGMKNQFPKGYWSAVFEQASLLLSHKAAASAEAAYWHARREVDHAFASGLSSPRSRGGRFDELPLLST